MAQVIKKLIPHTSYVAKFYHIPNLQKATSDRISLRPIVSNVCTIIRFIVACLVNYLKPYVDTFSYDHLRNNVYFKNKLQVFAQCKLI